MPAEPADPLPTQAQDERSAPAADHAQALAALVREHDRLLHSFLMARVRDEQEAREVAQEAYVRMLDLERPGAVSFMRAYLFKTAANIAIDRARQRRTRARIDEQEAIEEPIDELTPDRRLLSGEDVSMLKRALLELSPKCRRAFLLHRFEEWSDTQIADHLGIQPRMVRRYLARAAVYCRLRVQGYTASAAKAESDETY